MSFVGTFIFRSKGQIFFSESNKNLNPTGRNYSCQKNVCWLQRVASPNRERVSRELWPCFYHVSLFIMGL